MRSGEASDGIEGAALVDKASLVIQYEEKPDAWTRVSVEWEACVWLYGAGRGGMRATYL